MSYSLLFGRGPLVSAVKGALHRRFLTSVCRQFRDLIIRKDGLRSRPTSCSPIARQHPLTDSDPRTKYPGLTTPTLLPSFAYLEHANMSPSISYISGQLRQLIYYHLDNNLCRNALFLAGRLHAYEPRTAEASYLLALCHLQNGQVKAAYDYSRNFGSRGTHLGCSYVFAQACLDLGKYLEGITALERSKGLWASKNHWSKHSSR